MTHQFDNSPIVLCSFLFAASNSSCDSGPAATATAAYPATSTAANPAAAATAAAPATTGWSQDRAIAH